MAFTLSYLAWAGVAFGQTLSPAPAAPVAAPASAPLVGVTVYAPDALLRFAQGWLAERGRAVTPQAVAEAIAQLYREDGFLLAEARWLGPPVSRWDVDEGRVTRIEITGLDAPTATRAGRYLQTLQQTAPRAAALERALALAGDLAGVSLTSHFAPLPEGGHVLQVHGEQTQRSGSLHLDVVPLRPGSAVRLGLLEERYGLFQPGDKLRLSAMGTREPRNTHALLGTASYRAPVGDGGTYVEALLGSTRAELDLALTPTRASLRGASGSLAVGHPWLRDLHRYGYGLLALEHAQVRAADAVGSPPSQAQVLRAYAVYGHTLTDGRFRQVTATLSAGRRPQAHATDGEARFEHLRLGAGFAGPLSLGEAWLTYRVEGALQWSHRALPRVEKVMLGHYPYLRGYAPAEVQGDRGGGMTAEITWRGRVGQAPWRARPFVFLAGGTVSSVALRSGATATEDSRDLMSGGVGLRAPLFDRVELETWIATPWRTTPRSARGSPVAYLSLALPW